MTHDSNPAAEEALAKILHDASGFDLRELDRRASFLELGFDSLFLIQFTQKIKNKLKVKVTFRQLIEEIPTLDALVRFRSRAMRLQHRLVRTSVARPAALRQLPLPLPQQFNQPSQRRPPSPLKKFKPSKTASRPYRNRLLRRQFLRVTGNQFQGKCRASLH